MRLFFIFVLNLALFDSPAIALEEIYQATVQYYYRFSQKININNGNLTIVISNVISKQIHHFNRWNWNDFRQMKRLNYENK